MSIEAILAFAAAMVVFGLTPGPVVLATIARCLAGGFRAGIALNVGVIASDLVFLFAAVYGLSFVAAALGEFFLAVKIVGAGYLIWLGIQTWRADSTPPVEMAPKIGRGVWRDIAAGFLLGISNPKGILFYGALLPNFLDVAAMSHGDVGIAAAVVVVALSVVNLGYGALAARVRLLLRSRQAMRNLNRGVGSVMIGTGLVVASQ
jgi:threonine/homoserine/homoserine lactone efflux protein